MLWDPAQSVSTARDDVPGYARVEVVKPEYRLEAGRNIINFYFEEI